MNLPHNIYIHVPFCMSKCNYCAFFSHACNQPDWQSYADSIISEINDWHMRLGQIQIPTIFFGGGTPSLMPTAIFERIMIALRDKFKISDDCEITLESNPGTLDITRLQEFQGFGVNRLSVGVQSFDDDKLNFLGRRHNANDALNLIQAASNHGLRVSGDFIYGLPGETVSDVIKTCKKINDLGINHCSLYELTIEPNTPFGKMNLDMPSNNTMADMYMAIDENLKLPRYEVSNYCTTGNECRHNQNVWDGAPYIGIGNGAAGRVFCNNQWYEQRGANMQFDTLDNHSRAIEMIITGLRQVRGVKITDDVKNVLNMDFIANNPQFVQIMRNNRLAVTKDGMLILDDIIQNIIK